MEEDIRIRYNKFNLVLGVGTGITSGAIGAYSRLKYSRVGLEASIGLSDFDNKLTHWSLGAKLFPFRPSRNINLSGICMSVHYGTVAVKKTDSYNYENGEFGIGGIKQISGWSFMAGYDTRLFRNININTGIGISSADQTSFAWNIGIGWAF
jgi:hypothetical protein